MIAHAPLATLTLFATIAISLYTLMQNEPLKYKLMLHPYSVFRYRQYHLLLTHGFIHADFLHLAFNMLTFYFFAPAFEEYYAGSWGFALVYFGSMIISAVVTTLQRQNNEAHRSLGASGAVSGLLFGFILFNPSTTLLVFFLPMPAWLFAIVYVGYSYYAARNTRSVIDHEAHLWGAIAGLVITLILRPDALSIFVNQMFG